MEYNKKQICNECLNENVVYKFVCQSCGLLLLTCQHNVSKCNDCNKFFCKKCLIKCQKKHNLLSNES